MFELSAWAKEIDRPAREWLFESKGAGICKVNLTLLLISSYLKLC